MSKKLSDRWQTQRMRKILKIVFKFCLPAMIACGGLGAQSALAQSSLSPTNASSAADGLLEKYTSLAGQLAQNQYRRPLFLESTESTNAISGDIYAEVDSPFSTLSATFKSPERWCDVLILHINTKFCRASTDSTPSTLRMSIGKKTPQTLQEASSLEFSYRLIAASTNYLAVQLNADKGPLGTNNYRIVLEVVPISEGKTFLHLRYSYGYGLVGRLAMQSYLATVGQDKVGFNSIKQGSKLVLVGGVRGTVERNTMRYYLAIEAYLASLNRPMANQFDARLQYWFNATEDYPQQLHEVDKKAYLAMKKDEYRRQQTTPYSAN